MKLVSTPYRWLPRTIWTNVSHWFYDIKNGVSNLFTFFEAVWWFRSWDWTGMLALLETSAREMRKSQENGRHVGAEKDAKQLLIVEALCKRLQADEYFENAGYHGHVDWKDVPDHRKTQIAKHSHYMAKKDAEYLGEMMRFVQHWWD